MHKSHLDSPNIHLPNGIRESLFANSSYGYRGRSATPMGRNIPSNTAHLMSTIEGDLGAEEDPRLAIFRDLYNKSEARLNQLLGEEVNDKPNKLGGASEAGTQENDEASEVVAVSSTKSLPKPSRNINEDDYDESDEDDEPESVNVSPLKSRSTLPTVALPPSSSAMFRGSSSSSTPVSIKGSSSSIAGKTTEEARKKLEEDKKATEESAKRNFHKIFYTLENDKDAMLEQEKEESEQQVDVEMGVNGVAGNHANGFTVGAGKQGTLSQTNLGASSLALKNLIRVIDANRGRVSATDLELRGLFGEVRKGRSKWSSDDKIGQEELYESAETVLNLLRGKPEQSSVFLTRVNKKDAPDYGNSRRCPTRKRSRS